MKNILFLFMVTSFLFIYGCGGDDDPIPPSTQIVAEQEDSPVAPAPEAPIAEEPTTGAPNQDEPIVGAPPVETDTTPPTSETPPTENESPSGEPEVTEPGVSEEPQPPVVVVPPVIEEPQPPVVVEPPVIEEPQPPVVVEPPVIEEPQPPVIVEPPVIEEEFMLGWTEGLVQDQELIDSVQNAALTRTLLIEKVTAAGCPLCPDVTFLIDDFQEEYGEQIIAVKYHWGFLATGNFVDVDFTTPKGNEIVAEVLNTRGQPRGYVSRAPLIGETAVSSRATSWAGVINERIGESSDLFLDAKTTVNGNSVDVNVTLISKDGINTSDSYRINVFVTEDNIIHNQSGATSDFVHTEMFRDAATDIFGELIDIDINASTEYRFGTQFDLQSDWVSENLNVVVFITQDDDSLNTGGQILQTIQIPLQ